MTSHRWLAALCLALCALTALVAYVGKPTRYLAEEIGQPDLDKLFPEQFGTWRKDNSLPAILPSPDVQAQLDKIYNKVLSRTYVSPQGERVMLSVAYGGDQSDGTRIHRPEVCYPAQGFQISSNRVAMLPLGQGKLKVRQLESHLGGRHEPITYWVVVGEEVATSASEQKLAQMRLGLKGLIPDGMLVRVSSIDRESPRAFELHARFAADLAALLPGNQRARVFGATRG